MPLLGELAELSVELPHRDALGVEHLVLDNLILSRDFRQDYRLDAARSRPLVKAAGAFNRSLSVVTATKAYSYEDHTGIGSKHSRAQEGDVIRFPFFFRSRAIDRNGKGSRLRWWR